MKGSVSGAWGYPLATLALLAGVALVVTQTWLEHSPRMRADIVALASARFSSAPDSPTARAVALPDHWRYLHPAPAQGWYRLRFTLLRPPMQNWDLYLPHLRMNARIFVNGDALPPAGHLKSPITRHFNHPLLFPIPPQALHVGDNRISIHLATEPPGIGSLGRVYVGPIDGLKATYLQQYALKVVAPRLIALMMALVGALTGAVWLRRPRDTVYGWFAAATLAWALNTLEFCVTGLPIPTRLWDAAQFATLGWANLFYVLFTHRYTGCRRPLLERTLWIAASMFSAWAFLVPDYATMFRVCADFGTPGCAALDIYCAAQFFRHYRRHHDINAFVMSAVALFGIPFVIYDALAICDLWIGSDSRYGYFAAPFVLAGFLWCLIDRFAHALQDSESLNRDLEAIVRHRTTALEASHERLRALERERVLGEERVRMMREMHDGVGGRLVATLCVAERGGTDFAPIVAGLRQTLRELRLTIDSIDPGIDDLGLLLGALREHCDTWMLGTGLELRWDLDPVAMGGDQVPVSPDFVLNVLRIGQEAVANTLKHARARHFTVRAEIRPTANGGREFLLALIDDGIGRTQAGASPLTSARGLKSMRWRAERLGGELEIDDRDGNGTRVLLRVPLPLMPARSRSG